MTVVFIWSRVFIWIQPLPPSISDPPIAPLDVFTYSCTVFSWCQLLYSPECQTMCLLCKSVAESAGRLSARGENLASTQSKFHSWHDKLVHLLIILKFMKQQQSLPSLSTWGWRPRKGRTIASVLVLTFISDIFAVIISQIFFFRHFTILIWPLTLQIIFGATRANNNIWLSVAERNWI